MQKWLAFCFRQRARQAGLCQGDDVFGWQNVYSDSIQHQSIFIIYQYHQARAAWTY
jgi:hypothetical protein